MKLGFHSATTKTSDLQTDVQAAARAGFKSLELWADKVDCYLAHHSLADLRALLADEGLAPLALNSIEFIAFRGDETSLVQSRCRQMCQIARAIGCPTLVVVPSPTPDRTTRWPDVVAEHVKVLRDLSDIAGGYGVRLAFEFLGFGWCSVRTPRAAYEIVCKTGRDNVGMVIDAAHFYGGGGLLAEIGQLDPNRIYAFHLDDLEDGPKEAITDAARLMPGLGVVPLGDICAQLRHIGYDGPCSIELFRPEYWEWDPNQVALQAREAALRVLSPYFKIE